MAKTSIKAKNPVNVKSKSSPRSGDIYGWLVFLFAFLLFANSIPNGYNMDDELVTKNHRLTSKGIAAIPTIFTSPYYQDESGYSYEYRPVVLASFAIEHEIFGDIAPVSHFFNVLLYALLCLLLYKALRMLFAQYSPFLPLSIALIFAAHPAHTEVVCSIKNRDEILSLLFGLMALYTAAKAVKKAQPYMIIATAFFFTLALMSKVTIISFSILIPLALILFSSISARWVAYVTIALVLPAFLIVNLNGGVERVEISLGIMIAVGLLYLAADHRLTIPSIKGALTDALYSTSQAGDQQKDDGLMNIRERLLPETDIWDIKAFIIAIVLACLYILAIWAGYTLWACPPMAILLLLSWRGGKKISWWSTLMIGISFTIGLGIISVNYTAIDKNEWYRELLCLYLAYQIFFGKRGLLLPSVLCFAIANYINIAVSGNFNGLFALFVILLTFRYARIFILILVSAINIFQIFQGIEGALNLINWGVLAAVSLSIHFNKARKEIAPALAAVVFVIFQIFQTHGITTLPVQRATAAINKQLNPKIVSNPQNRPLTYMEDCATIDMPAAGRAAISMEILFHYLHKVILPYPLSFYYGYRFIYPQQMTDTIPILSTILYVALFFAGMILIRRNRVVSFGILVYLISVVVFANYFQPVPGMLADRFLLIPSLGWIIALSGIVILIFKPVSIAKIGSVPLPGAGGRYIFAAILILYSGITFSRNFEWKTDLDLFRHDIGYVDQSAQAHNLLALHIMQRTVTETDPAQKSALEKEALLHFKKAQSIYPYFFNIAYDIGRVYTGLNMPDSAIAAFKYSLTLDTLLSDDYLSLSTLLMSESRYQEAVPYLRSVIRITPDAYVGYDKLSYAFFLLKQYDQSIAVNLTALQHVKSNPDPAINIARVFIAKNQPDSALIYLNKAKVISPQNPAIRQLMQQIGR